MGQQLYHCHINRYQSLKYRKLTLFYPIVDFFGIIYFRAVFALRHFTSRTLVSDDWKVAIKARAESACTLCRAVATKSGEAD